MPERAPHPAPLHPLRWLPEFLTLAGRRLRPQARLMGLSLVIGVIAGLGAVAFHSGCLIVSHYSLGALAHYYPEGPKREPQFFKEGKGKGQEPGERQGEAREGEPADQPPPLNPW